MLMEHLARKRAEACCEALEGMGVERRLMVVTARGDGNQMKTEFHALLEEDLRQLRGMERAGQRERQRVAAQVARRRVMKVIEDNDVFFNGARERATKESP